ncbi:MAG: PAS domain-containing protein [Candidatus Solibacter sp.]|nr:PAS domain-containing protein [Candidatus Solibacter sp.]
MRIRPHGRYRLAVAVIPTLIRQLSQREAAHGQPVQVRGRVTYIDQARRLMTVQDSSGGVRVNLTTEIPQLGMGQLVDAAGTTQAGTTTGEVRASRVQVVDGSAQLPVPKILSPAALAANPQLDYEWFEVKGTVHGVSQRPNAHPYLAVVTPEGTVEVRGSGGNPSRLARLAGQQVRVRGVAHAVRGARGEVLHLEMWLGDWSGVSRLAPPAPLQEKSGAVLPTLRSVGAIRELGLAEADRGYPVSLVAVITAKYDSGTALYVQDDTGAVYVSGAGDTRKLRAGDRVAIEGSTSRGGFSADVVARQVRRLGVGTMPSPAEVPLPDLSRGGCDTRWIQTEGTVVGIERGVSAWQVDVEEGWRRLAAVIEASEPDLLELGLNARVRFTGVCDAVTDDWGRATGVRVLVPDVRFLQVLAQGLADPFALPVTPIGNLMRVSPTGELQQRVRISGTVSAVPPGSFGMFYLQDDTGGALVHAPRGSVVVGNLLDVVGLTVPRPLPTAVADAEFRVREGRAALKPVLMTAEEAVFGDYDAQLVSVDGVLLAHASLPDFQELTLQSGVIAYTAALDNREPAGRWSGLQTGSLLRLSGVCIIEQVGGKNTRGFRIVLRSAEDVTVLQSASWWTVEHVASVAVGLAVAALLALFWGSMLRERVRQQTAQGLRSAKTLRAVFDGAPDAMLIVNDSSACIDVNPAACDLLGQSMDELLNPPHLVLGSLGLTQFPQARRGTTLIPRTDGKFAEIDYSIRKDFLPERHLLILRDVTEQAAGARAALRRQLHLHYGHGKPAALR